MTRRTNARIAGVAFLVYIVAGIGSMALRGRGGHASDVLVLFTSFCAVLLGVTLYSITHDQDPDLALIGLACRLIEAVQSDGAIYFAVGSTLFCWLLLRGRMIPVALAWFGVLGSLMLVVLLLLQRAAWFGGALNWSSPVTWAVWFPMLVFEVSLALYLLIHGVRAPAPRLVPR